MVDTFLAVFLRKILSLANAIRKRSDPTQHANASKRDLFHFRFQLPDLHAKDPICTLTNP